MCKKTARLKRAEKCRKIIRLLGVNRLTVHRSSRHIYAQVTSADGTRVLVSSSTQEKLLASELENTGNVEAAKKIGNIIAERALSIGIKSVAFDRSGYKYHGRIKALADAARESGLVF